MTAPTPGTAHAPGPSRGGRADARWAVVTAGLLAVATFLAFRTTREMSILGNSGRLLAEIMGWWVLWAAALVSLRRVPRRTALLLVVLGAVALRVAAMTIVVPLSDDLYRYAWDGRVQASGTDPYRYPPVADELAPLRDDWLFPDDEECAERGKDPGCTIINRPTVRTIYPPLAQVWFLGGHVAGASHLEDLGWQVVALVADVAVCGALAWLLVRRGRDPRWVAVYAWSPVAVLEGVQNGHVDGLATLFVVLAVAAAGRRPAWAGAALGAAAMVKLYPALLLPVLLSRRPLRVVAAFTAVCVLSYLPHLLVLGGDVLGYLPGYLQEEDYGEGTRYLLLWPLGLPAAVATAAALLAAAAVLARVLRTVRAARPGDDLAPAACLLLGGALLVATPVQPWYGLPLAALAALAGRPWWFAVPAAAYPVFFQTVAVGPGPTASRTGSATYLAALVVVVVGERRARRTTRGPAAALPGPS